MAPLSTIIVAGDPQLRKDLEQKLPGDRCSIVLLETIPEVLQQAANAALIIVSAQMRGGGENLCRQLRADPLTANTPLFVRGTSHQRVPCADEVLSNNLQQTIDVVETYLPELCDNDTASSEQIELSDEDIFDITESADVWRRRSDERDWPVPPQKRPGQKMRDFAADYAGYVTVLLEGFEAALSAESRNQLIEVAGLAVDTTDDVLSSIQEGVNDCLKRGDLTGMRELSAGKNVLFGKLRQLKALHGAPPAATPERAERPPSSPQQLATMLESTGPEQLAGAALDSTGPQPKSRDLGATGPSPAGGVKSRLTMAAEAKEKERQQVALAAARAAREQSARTRPARRGGRAMVFALIGLVAVGAAAWFVLGVGRNHPPVMSFVTAQQTPTEIRARVSARDEDQDSITYTYKWLVNGQPIAGATAPTLAVKNYSINSKVQVHVTPHDGKTRGQTMRCRTLMVVQLSSGRAAAAQ